MCPLIPGSAYELSYYLSLADICIRAIDEIGAYFSANALTPGLVPNVVPQFETPTGYFITEKDGWVRISDTLIATGNERFLTIGNFQHDSTTSYVSGLGGYAHFSYYFIDDVALQPISAPPPPVHRPILGNDTLLCYADTLWLNAYDSPANYCWQDSSVQPFFAVTEPGVYWVQRFSNCELQADSIEIAYDSLWTVDLGKDTVLCPGQTLTLGVQVPQAVYRWPDGSAQSNFTVSTPGSFWVEVTDRCFTQTDTVLVEYAEPPQLDILGSDTTLCPGDSLLLQAAVDFSSFVWNDGSTDSVLWVREPGTYWVAIDIGCTPFSDTLTILPVCLLEFEMPNVFTPNGDGSYDVFVPVVAEGVSQLDYSVFNRWGERVFQSTPQAGLWDGSFSGTYCAEGVYYWKATLVDWSGVEHQRTGSLTLLR